MITNIAFVGGERQVNLLDPLNAGNGIAGNQFLGGVTTLPNGNFVAIYSNPFNGVGDDGVMAVQFTAAGAVVANTPMNVDDDGEPPFAARSPDVTWRLGGGFAAVWVDSTNPDPNHTHSNYISIGVVPGGSTSEPSEVEVDNIPAKLSDPDIATFANGNYIIICEVEGSNSDIRYTVMNAAGNSHVKFGTYLANSGVDEQNAHVETSGNLAVVVYQDEDGNNSGSDRISLKLIDSTGAILDTDVVADISASLTQPDLAALPDGRFVIVYENRSTDQLLGRIYDPATKTLSGAAFQVARDVGTGQPTIAGLPDGGFLVAWTGDITGGGDDDTLARRFDSGGQAAGAIFRVNTSTFDEQDSPGIAVNASGRIFAAWSDSGLGENPHTTDTDHGVQGQFLAPTGVINGTPNADAITSYNVAETISGLAGNDTINARGGDDTVAGDEGNDVMTGGPGADGFLFRVKPRGANADQIGDYSVAEDTILLDNAVFKKLKATGALKKKFFEVGKKADDANDYVIYNRKDGAVKYDKNGDDKGGVKLIATVTPKLAMTEDDFFVV